jgi:hypothetical protein
MSITRPYVHISAVIAAVTLSDAPAPAQQRSNPRPNNLFTVSGFEPRIADTPERLAQLRKLPPNKLVTRTRDNKMFFIYADPSGCNCAYVGTPEAYRTYQNGGPSGYVGDAGATGQPRFDSNRMSEEMSLDRYVNDPNVPVFNNFLFGR